MTRNETILEIIKSLKSNVSYWLLSLTLSLLYFITTNIQFWMSDYLVEINEVPYETTVILFAFVSITAPIGGAIASGFIGKALGGFQSKHTILFVTLVTFVTAFLAVPIPLIPSNILVFTLIWILFFMGGICVPMQTGIMLSLVEPEIRPQATAISNIMYNAIGYFPAPFIYGLIQQNTGGKLSKWGMIFTMSMLIPMALLMAASMYYKPDMKEYWEQRKK